MPKVFLLF